MTNVGLRFEEEKTPSVSSFTSPPPVTQSTSNTESAATQTAPFNARRYDEATTQKALTLALRLQQEQRQEHQSGLTTEQIISIGHEADVAPEFVLQALAALEAEHQATLIETVDRVRTEAPQTTQTVRATQETTIPIRRLTRREKFAAWTMPLLFSIMALLVFSSASWGLRSFDNKVSLFVLFILAPIFALFQGAILRGKRLGFLSGMVLGVSLVVAAIIASPEPNLGMMIFFAFVFGIIGALLGLTSGLVRKHCPRAYHRFLAAFVRRFPGLAEI